MLFVFDDMIADMVSNKKLNPIVAELFIRGRKLNISPVCFTQSYFAVPERYQTKFNTLFRYQNFKQKRTSSNCI